MGHGGAGVDLPRIHYQLAAAVGVNWARHSAN